jgi:maleate isomerase
MTDLIRLGFILPAGNTTLEAEVPARLEGLGSAHYQRFTRLVFDDMDIAPTERAIAEAATVLRSAKPTVVALAYTAGSYFGGTELDRRLIGTIADESDARATTAADAIVSALRALGVAKVAVVSPYKKEVNERCERYLTAAGLIVTAVVGSPPDGPAGSVPLGDIAQMIATAAGSHADAVLVSCTALRTFSLIDELESSLGIPVVSSNSATLWAALRLAGSAARLDGLGALYGRS